LDKLSKYDFGGVKKSILFDDFKKLDPVNCLSAIKENDIFVNQNFLRREF
jgi:hypothetical protein